MKHISYTTEAHLKKKINEKTKLSLSKNKTNQPIV